MYIFEISYSHITTHKSTPIPRPPQKRESTSDKRGSESTCQFPTKVREQGRFFVSLKLQLYFKRITRKATTLKTFI